MVHYPFIRWQEIAVIKKVKRAAAWKVVKAIKEDYQTSAQIRSKGAVLTRDFAHHEVVPLEEVMAFLNSIRNRPEPSM